MSIRIGQASLGETGGRGQQPGNQNGRELNFSNWYNGYWLGILRFKNAQEAEKAAQACEDGVRNKNIGYDMDGRNTAYKAAETVDFDLSRIDTPVETDCSAFMMLCAVSGGVEELQEVRQQLHDVLHDARLAEDRSLRASDGREVPLLRRVSAPGRYSGIVRAHSHGACKRRESVSG